MGGAMKTLDEAIGVFTRNEVPGSYINDGSVLEVAKAMKDAGDALVAERDRLAAELANAMERMSGLESVVALAEEAKERAEAILRELRAWLDEQEGR